MVAIERVMQWIMEGQLDALAQAMQQDASLVERPTTMGVSLLQFAAYCRNAEAVALLRSKLTTISLHEAASTGDLPAVRAKLSETPALLNAPAADGFTALGLASFFGQKEVVQYLLGAGADPNLPAQNSIKVAPLHSACAVSDYEVAKLLLEAGAKPNVKQQQDITPLHSAAHNCQLQLVKLLLENGADPHARTSGGQTPADMAREVNCQKVLDLLK